MYKMNMIELIETLSKFSILDNFGTHVRYEAWTQAWDTYATRHRNGDRTNS